MYDVVKTYPKVNMETVKKYLEIEESASINESIPGKNGALDSSIRGIWPGIRMCGRALTVKCGIGDNIMLHKAVSMAKEGDVLMITNGDFDEAGGMFGGMMAASLKAKGVAGVVIEGACRDTVLIKKLGIPVFARNICIKATTKLCPGTINHPMVIGGVCVSPGDLVFGDDDGVVVVQREQAESVLETASQREKNEEVLLEKILRGEQTTFQMFEQNYLALGLAEEPDPEDE